MLDAKNKTDPVVAEVLGVAHRHHSTLDSHRNTVLFLVRYRCPPLHASWDNRVCLLGCAGKRGQAEHRKEGAQHKTCECERQEYDFRSNRCQRIWESVSSAA